MNATVFLFVIFIMIASGMDPHTEPEDGIIGGGDYSFDNNGIHEEKWMEELQMDAEVTTSDDDPTQRFTFAIDLAAIFRTLEKIGFGLGFGFGSVQWKKGQAAGRKSGMAVGAGLDLHFRDCSGEDATNDVIIQGLRSLFNGSSRIKVSADYGDFFRYFGLLQTRLVDTSTGKKFSYLVSRPKMKDFVVGEGFGKGYVSGGGIGVGRGMGDIVADGNVSTVGLAFGIGFGDAEGLGKGPIVNVLTHFIKRLITNEGKYI